MERRAHAIAEAGGLDEALRRGALANPIDTTLAEGLVLGHRGVGGGSVPTPAMRPAGPPRLGDAGRVAPQARKGVV